MLRTAILLALSPCPALRGAPSAGTADSKPKPPSERQAVALNAFVEKVLARGSAGWLPVMISALIGVPEDAPYRGVNVWPDHVTDIMSHGFMVIVVESFDTDAVRPSSLALTTNSGWAVRRETYWFRASLEGRLEKAVRIVARRGEQRQWIAGSEIAAEQDIASSEIRERFQHELELWTRKTYFKKEWRSAEFSQGALTKKTR